MPTYFKDNQSVIDNKTLYSNNSILNANLSNLGIGSSVMGISNTNQSNNYKYNKNFFDTTTLNNINGAARIPNEGLRSKSKESANSI